MVLRFVVPCLTVLGLLLPNATRVCVGQANYWMVSQDIGSYQQPSMQDMGPYYAPTTDYSALTVDTRLDDRVNQGLFFQCDYVSMTFTPSKDMVIGDPAQEGWYDVNSIPTYMRNSLQTSWDSGEFSTGQRFDFGWAGQRAGLIASIMTIDHNQTVSMGGGTVLFNDPDNLLGGFQDSNDDGYDDDINLNNIFGRSGEDLGTPDTSPGSFVPPFDGIPDASAATDLGDLVWYFVTFGSLQATSHVEMNSMELMGMFRHPGSRFSQTRDWYLGVRYMEFTDELNVSGTESVMNGAYWDTGTGIILSGLRSVYVGRDGGVILACQPKVVLPRGSTANGHVRTARTRVLRSPAGLRTNRRTCLPTRLPTRIPTSRFLPSANGESMPPPRSTAAWPSGSVTPEWLSAASAAPRQRSCTHCPTLDSAKMGPTKLSSATQ